jgi:hypothetical protein
MGPRNAYKDILDKVVSPITCVSMNHQNYLKQMANGAMFATTMKYESILHGHPSSRSPNLEIPIPRSIGENIVTQTRGLTLSSCFMNS